MTKTFTVTITFPSEPPLHPEYYEELLDDLTYRTCEWLHSVSNITKMRLQDCRVRCLEQTS